MCVDRLFLDAAFDDMWNLLGLHAVNGNKTYKKIAIHFHCFSNIPNAIDDGTDGHTQCATGAVVVDVWQMRVLVEFDRLIARVGARHVTLAAVDAHVLQRAQRNNG